MGYRANRKVLTSMVIHTYSRNSRRMKTTSFHFRLERVWHLMERACQTDQTRSLSEIFSELLDLGIWARLFPALSQSHIKYTPSFKFNRMSTSGVIRDELCVISPIRDIWPNTDPRFRRRMHTCGWASRPAFWSYMLLPLPTVTSLDISHESFIC